MSHFSVLVIGDDVEAILQPYHEFECTGINDQYVQDVDVTEECKEEGFDYHDYHCFQDLVVSSEDEVEKVGDDAPHMYGYVVVKDGELIKAVKRTNPNLKWDSWCIGGRYQGRLTNKAGEQVNQTTIGGLDLDAMKAEKAADANAKYSEFEKVIAGRAYTSFDKLEGSIDERCNAYWDQPVINDLKNACLLDMSDDWFEKFNAAKSREEFVETHVMVCTLPWAAVTTDRWIERGSIGWFGMSDTNSESEAAYGKAVFQLLSELPPETKLTVVDCRI